MIICPFNPEVYFDDIMDVSFCNGCPWCRLFGELMFPYKEDEE